MNPEKNFDLGQHFLIDEEILKKEIEIADLSSEDKVIEVGAGEGVLTVELVKNAGEVLAFEIDKRYSETLGELEKENKNLEVIYDDALKHSWKGFDKIVSNIPYYISEQLVMKSIDDGTRELVLIVGEKFKKALEDKESKIGIISNLFYETRFVMKVDKSCFSPPPRVNSWLVSFKRKDKFSNSEKILISILGKKGKLKNAIIYSLVEAGKTKNEARALIGIMEIDEKILEKPTVKTTGKVLFKLKNKIEGLEKERRI